MSLDTYPWYAKVDRDASVTQGEFLFECPVLEWQNPSSDTGVSIDEIRKLSIATKRNLIVMTQACDLENRRLRNLVACPYVSIPELRGKWEEGIKEKGETPKAQDFRKYLSNIGKGFVNNLCLLDKSTLDCCPFGVLIVDFTQTYSLPVRFVQAYLKSETRPRVRLLPPYREHISQAFARFFMRVGLPQNIDVKNL